jgi:hypothetical protein
MTYTEALAEAKRTGLRRCSDAAAMAAFCDSTLQLIAGAVSGQLVWEGAQRKGLTFQQLAFKAAHVPQEVEQLQWI